MTSNQTKPAFLIHHLSDLHIGPSGYEPGKKIDNLEPDRKYPRNIEAYLNHIKSLDKSQLPDLVIITGDLTTCATKEEMQVAEKFIQHLLVPLRKKDTSWRNNASTKPPYIMIVPGNHDLDWSKSDYDAKVTEYARLADDVYNDGEVISALYPTNSKNPIYYDFEELNLLVYLLNTTVAGGTFDPLLTDIHEKIIIAFNQAKSAIKNINEVETALKNLEKQTMRDPGYIRKDDLLTLRSIMKTNKIPKSRFAIAVMHHNISSVPSEDIERFDAIVNAGYVKHALADIGFDMVLHGHRHHAHCCHERFVSTNESEPHFDEFIRDLFIVGADSLGSKELAPFLQLELCDISNAHSENPPASLFKLKQYNYNGVGYHQKPWVEEAVNQILHPEISEILRAIGRSLEHFSGREPLVRRRIQHLFPHFQQLHSSTVGWNPSALEWTEKFHTNLKHYNRIYATDVQVRRSASTFHFDNYIRKQFNRLLKNKIPLHFGS